MKAEEAVTLGKIQSERSLYPGKVMHNTEEEVQKAQEVVNAGYETSAGLALMAKYGFDSHYEPAFIVTRSRLGETLDVPLTAISFGEIAFAAFPYEMFDTNGKEARDGSPYKTTFVCSLANGSHGYIASNYAFPHGTYEVFACQYVQGTGEQLSGAMVEMLNECKAAS